MNTVLTIVFTTVLVFIIEKVLTHLFDTMKGKKRKR